MSYRVRWRVAGRMRSKDFAVAKFGEGKRAEQRCRDAAAAFDLDVKQQLTTTGVVRQRRGAELLDDVWGEWYRAGVARWTDATAEGYAVALERHILPRLGTEQVAAIKPSTIEAWISELQRAGVGPSAIAKATTVLSSLLSHCVRDDLIDVNPVRAARKAPAPREREPFKIEPLVVERLRMWFLDRGLLGDATLISLLAYAGLRPLSEGVCVEWRDYSRGVLTVQPNRKRGAKRREIRVLEPLAEDLAHWRQRSGRIGGLILPHGAGGVSPFGEAWTETDWNNWRGLPRRKSPKRKNATLAPTGRWAQAREAVGLPSDVIPRDLRGSFASLLIWEGRSVIDVARQLGHKPSTCLDVYAGEFERFDPTERRDAVEVIREARELVRQEQQHRGGLTVVKEAVSTAAAAAELGVTQAYVYQLAEKGHLERHQVAGVTRESLDAFIAAPPIRRRTRR